MWSLRSHTLKCLCTNAFSREEWAEKLKFIVSSLNSSPEPPVPLSWVTWNTNVSRDCKRECCSLIRRPIKDLIEIDKHNWLKNRNILTYFFLWPWNEIMVALEAQMIWLDRFLNYDFHLFNASFPKISSGYLCLKFSDYANPERLMLKFK